MPNWKFKTPATHNYFSGYFDKSALDPDSRRLAVLKTDFVDRMPSKDDQAQIGFFDITLPKPEFVACASTFAFNWQTGANLRWLSRDTLIFNNLNQNKADIVTQIVDISRKKIIAELPFSMASVSFDGLVIASLDYGRLHYIRRGYSYDGDFSVSKSDKLVPDESIKFFERKTARLIGQVGIDRCIDIKTPEFCKGGTQYLEHVQFSPFDISCVFLHRVKLDDGGIFSRLFYYNLDTDELKLLNNSGRVSHFNWKTQHELIYYGSGGATANTLRNGGKVLRTLSSALIPIYHRLVPDNSKLSKKLTGDNYIIQNIENGSLRKIKTAANLEDGHPSWIPGSDTFVTDTYPKKSTNHIATLQLIKMGIFEPKIVDKISSTPKYDETPLRCDLHPKLSECGKLVAVDTFIDGIRGVSLYEI